MIRYFCDVCFIEVDDPSFSLDMTGKVLCGKHFTEHEENNKNHHWFITWKDKYKKSIDKFIISKRGKNG